MLLEGRCLIDVRRLILLSLHGAIGWKQLPVSWRSTTRVLFEINSYTRTPLISVGCHKMNSTTHVLRDKSPICICLATRLLYERFSCPSNPFCSSPKRRCSTHTNQKIRIKDELPPLGTTRPTCDTNDPPGYLIVWFIWWSDWMVFTNNNGQRNWLRTLSRPNNLPSHKLVYKSLICVYLTIKSHDSRFLNRRISFCSEARSHL